MAETKVRISELTEAELEEGLWTIGVNSRNESVKVSLDSLWEAGGKARKVFHRSIWANAPSGVSNATHRADMETADYFIKELYIPASVYGDDVSCLICADIRKNYDNGGDATEWNVRFYDYDGSTAKGVVSFTSVNRTSAVELMESSGCYIVVDWGAIPSGTTRLLGSYNVDFELNYQYINNLDNFPLIKQYLKNEELAANTALEGRIGDLEDAVWPIEISLTATSTLLEYTGADQSVTLTEKTTRKGETLTDKLGYWFKGSSWDTKTGTLYSGATGNSNMAVTVNTNGSTVFGFYWYVDGGDKDVEATITIRQALPMYFGFSTETTASSTLITSLTKQGIKTSPSGTYSLTASADGYAWFCVPSSMTISKVTLNGFDVPLEGYETASTSLGTYKCYRSGNALVAGTYTFVIS